MSEFDYEKFIIDIPDYPEPGVIFKDITPLIADPTAFATAIDDLADHFKDTCPDKVVGAEARGFLIGAPVAAKLGAGFIPARKPGKLPREVYSTSYDLEYGSNELQIHKDAIKPGDKVLVIDDLVATGGTTVATAQLVERAGGIVVGFGFLMELAFLNPRKTIAESYDQDVYSLIKVN